MRNKLLILFALALSSGGAANAGAAQISCEKPDRKIIECINTTWNISGPNEPNCMGRIRIRGQITPGDFETFRSMPKNSEPYAGGVDLLSLGGDVREATRIGTLIRDRLLTTWTADRLAIHRFLDSTKDTCEDEHCVCASACFFIWAGGIDRSGDALIIHRPRDISGTFGKKPAAQASDEYTMLLSIVAAYLRKMEIP